MFARMMQMEKKKKETIILVLKKKKKAPDSSNLHEGKEAAIGTRHRAMYWFKIGKRVC